MEIRLALIGFGGVNRAFAEILRDRGPDLAAKGHHFKICAVCDQRFGEVVVQGGVDLCRLTETTSDPGAFASLVGGGTSCDVFSILARSGADVAVEATYSNRVDGEPALSHCRAALELGMHVVTTNKGPVGFAGHELTAIAAKHNRSFRFEGTVMSGTPVIRLANQCLAGNPITGFRGVLNGTANYVLGRIEDGLSMSASIAEAQALGYAEANPDADLKGWDVALKVTILANMVMGGSLVPENVACAGIDELTEDKIRNAIHEGLRWKLVGEANRSPDGTIIASVSPQLLPTDDPLYGVSGAANAVTFHTELLSAVTVSGPGAGKVETAYAILSDLLSLK
jgi:homoserine dehydrogenase